MPRARCYFMFIFVRGANCCCLLFCFDVRRCSKFFVGGLYMWIELEMWHGSPISFCHGSQSGQTQGDCFQSLLSAIVAGIKRTFAAQLQRSSSFALHHSFKLTWLLFWFMLKLAMRALNWCEAKKMVHLVIGARRGEAQCQAPPPPHSGPVA